MQSLSNKLRTVIVTAVMASVLMACGSAATNAPATSSAPTSAPVAAAPTSAPTTAAAAPTTADAAQATSAPAAATAPAATAPAAAAQSSGTTAPVATKLNLNELTEEQVMSTIPNFPSRMVREFMEYRPYISIQQFRKEIGKYVSPDVVASYEQYVYVPVDVNQADAATLQQLPGVDAAIADQLIAARPYSSNQAFLDKLASVVPAADAQQASAYLATK